MSPTTGRAERIHARLRAARWSGIGRYQLERWTLAEGCWLFMAIAAFVISLFEPWLWGWNWAALGLSEGVARGLIWLPAALIAGNALLFRRLLALETPRDLVVVPWVAVLRTVLASLPLAAMIALPAWRGFVARRPRWAFRPRSAEALPLRLPAETGARPAIAWRSAQRARLAQIALLASFLAGFTALLALGFGLGRLGALRPTPAVLAGFAVLHLAGYASARVGLRREIADRQMNPRTVAALHALAALWLLPFPGPLAAFLARFLERSERTSDGLVWSAHAERSAERRSPGFRSMAEELAERDPSGGRPRPRLGLPDSAPVPRASLAVGRRRAFLRWQTLLLALDAGLLIYLSHWIGRRSTYVRSVVKIATFAAIGLAVMGFAVWLSLLALQAWRQSETSLAARWKDASYSLGLTNLALLLGSQTAIYLTGSEDPRRVWALVAVTCGAAAVSRWFFVMVSQLGHRQERKPWLSAFAWLFLGWIAVLVTWGADWSTMATRMLATVAFLSPLWHLILVHTLGDWLFWPVSWQQAFDSRLPNGVRWRLRFVALVAVFPLGGWVAPFWPFFRTRLTPAAVQVWWEIRREG